MIVTHGHKYAARTMIEYSKKVVASESAVSESAMLSAAAAPRVES